MTDTTANQPGLHAHRASFTVAVHAARDQVVHAAGVIAATTIDLVGAIGRAVLADLQPARRRRRSPRVVKRAISKHRAKGDIDRTNHHTTTEIKILWPDQLTAGAEPQPRGIAVSRRRWRRSRSQATWAGWAVSGAEC